MLDQIIPFRYLSRVHQEGLLADASFPAFRPGEVLIQQGDVEDRRVFLLLEGSVEAVDVDKDPPARLRTVSAGHYFGERAALFEEERSAEIRALEPVRAVCISGERFLKLIRGSTTFAQALGNVLRDKQGVFTPFDRFEAELKRAVGRGFVDFNRLLPLYRALEPAIHPHAGASGMFDPGALRYAVHRLPENVTRTLAFYVTETLPALYSDPDRRFTKVATGARRRAVYEMIPGKNMVLIRDGISDLVDLVTCLCLYAIEARKIRRHLRDKGGLDHVEAADLEALHTVWPEDTLERVTELALHHEDFHIEIHKELDHYDSAHSEAWVQQIAATTRELMGHDPSDLPDDLPVHVISSNTHSVTNCLSPWLAENADALLHWARETGHDLVREEWDDPRDLAYVLARDYLDAHPEARREKAETERRGGIFALEWTAFTGIGVQLIDTAQLTAASVDPGLPDPRTAPRSLIVNIDYAFGEQAEHIIANLMSMFGRHLTSVSVLGKAGGLEGERGDVFVASGFVEQSGDQYYPVPSPAAVDMDRLARFLFGRNLREGNALTVTGTLLQNRKMLQFNRHIWRCVGLEMEGAFYLRRILRAMNSGALSRDVAVRFLYYVSDLPLRHDATLSSRLRAVEGVPPLYAITREVLSGILDGNGGLVAEGPGHAGVHRGRSGDYTEPSHLVEPRDPA